MNHSIRVLHLEDDPHDAELIQRKLKSEGLSFEIVWVDRREAFESALEREVFDLVLTDYNLPDYDGMSALKRAREKQPDLPVIAISGTLGEEEAVECLKAGATDYVLKQRLQRLGAAVRAALDRSRLKREARGAEIRLRESEKRFRQMAENIRDVFFLVDADSHRILYISPAYAEIWGRSCESAYANPESWTEAIHPDDRASIYEKYKQGMSAGTFEFEYRIVRPDGSMRWIEARGFPVRDAAGRMVRIASVAEDITERKEAENKIRRLNRVYAVLSGINALIARARDRDELFREACRIAVGHGRFNMVWIGVVDRTGMRVMPVASAGSTEDFLTLVNQRFSLREEVPYGNTLAARAIREKKAIFSNDVQSDPAVAFKEEHAKRGSRSMAIVPLVVSDDAVGVLALYADEIGFFDEAEMKLLRELAGDIAFAIDHIDKQERLDYLAYYDVLTGLANRSLFLERVAQYMRSAASGGHKLALFVIDLERFKNINDSLGRPAGDALLRQVTEWLTRDSGDVNVLARVDADHFAVVLPEVKQEGDVARFLEKTMAALLEHPFRLNDAVYRIAAKAGVALFPDDGADADALFRNAEAALKKAKASGDRYLMYTQSMTETMRGKLTLENQLRQALEQGEFVLHYQPKVNLETRRIVGVEALIRWQSPELGLVPPASFIPLMEETGLILETGAWALERAVADHLRWHELGLQAPRVAVNVSPIQLRQRDFVATLRRAVAPGAKPPGVDLEITESIIMTNIEENIEKVKAARDLGLSIAIDDFGTGYSSLGYLAKLPVQALKIDHSFIVSMASDPNAMTLISTIISLAHSLRLTVIAEGVETEEQARMLRLLRCQQMQGFLFCKPLPLEEMTDLLKQQRPG
ncbi:MAG: diguanylate cyclase [Betaproteobacteria bacterium RIFCSPLOWO2_12_FULL_67_28]|nr:MAG: diguanylate cyclase [Betaproteobacteria bacterium RIFCSPLOWO2_12_FULL_67_28]